MTNVYGFPWKEWETRLRELQQQSPDASAEALACALSSEVKIYVNKNMVIGKLHRMGLWPSQKSAKRQNIVRMPSELIPIGQRCTILDLTPTTCHWIVGDSRKPLEKIYCGANGADLPLQPYCKYHADRAVRAKVPSAKTDIRMLRKALTYPGQPDPRLDLYRLFGMDLPKDVP